MEYVQTDIRLSDDDVGEWPTPTGKVRRIGWLDQRGRIYRHIPEGAEAWHGGSFTALLFELGDD